MATPEELTQWLASSGYLESGEVTAVQVETSGYTASLSALNRLTLTYSSDATGTCPGTCLEKTSSGPTYMLGRAEATFYRTMAEHNYTRNLPVVYAAVNDDEAQTASVLMGELTDTLTPREWPVPPASDLCRNAVLTLADFHADWAGSTLMEHALADQAGSGRFSAERYSAVSKALIERLGDALTPERATLIETLAQAYPAALEERITTSSLATVVHGDAHFWNMLFPRDPAQPPTLIDWQVWGADLGTADLAYMMALHWFPERRARFERSLVDAYAQRLGQPQDLVWSSYRFSVAGLIPRTALFASVIPAFIWWPHLERAFNAYDDLECREFFS